MDRPSQEAAEDGSTSLLALQEALLGIERAPIFLDIKEGLPRLESDGRAAVSRIESLPEVAPSVHMTATFDDAVALESLIEDTRSIRHGQPAP